MKREIIITEEGTFEFTGILTEGTRMKIMGYNVWDYKWLHQGKSTVVHHPSYPHQTHTFYFWKLDINKKDIYFYAGEYSNNVWGFFKKSNRLHK